MNIRAVIFDRDNTLLHFDPTAVAAIEARIAAAAPTLPPGAVTECWAAWPGPWPRASSDEPGFWQSFWDSIAHQFGLPNHEVAALEQIGTFYHTCFAVYPDSVACLAALRAADLRLAVLTNFELPSVDRTLHYAGIDPSLFEVLLSSVTIGYPKPDPRAYQAVASALGLHPGECAFVDDLPENVAAARALGMSAWLLDRSSTSASITPSHIHSLDEFINRLEIQASWHRILTTRKASQ